MQGRAEAAAAKNLTPAQRRANEEAPNLRAAEEEAKEKKKVEKARALQHKRDVAIHEARGERRIQLEREQAVRKKKADEKAKKLQAISARELAADLHRSDHDRPAEPVR